MFQKANLKLLENTGASTPNSTVSRVYTFVTDDTSAVVEAAGYFNGVLDNGLNPGDIIMAIVSRATAPKHKTYVVTAGGAAVTIKSRSGLVAVPVRVAVLGTASTHYAASPVAGKIVGSYGVSNGNGATASGIITITAGGVAVATQTYPAGYVAGAVITGTAPAAHSIAQGGPITVATDGGGDGAGEVNVMLLIDAD